MAKKNWLTQPALYLVIAFYFLWGFTTLGYNNVWGDFFYPEDRYFENVGAISLFIAAFIMSFVYFKAYKLRKVLDIHWIKLLFYSGLAFLFFFGGGEEISWGQRIFGIAEPPVLSNINMQGELNVHNLAVFEASEFFKADSIFNVFLFVFTALLPFGSLVSKKIQDFVNLYVPIMFWGLGALFFVDYIGAKLAAPIYISVYNYLVIPFPQAVQEVKESNYEFLFVFVALWAFYDLHQQVITKQPALSSGS